MTGVLLKKVEMQLQNFPETILDAVIATYFEMFSPFRVTDFPVLNHTTGSPCGGPVFRPPPVFFHTPLDRSLFVSGENRIRRTARRPLLSLTAAHSLSLALLA